MTNAPAKPAPTAQAIPQHEAAIAPDGRMVYTSVSAIKKFTTCKRAWWYRYKLRLPDPQGAGAILGTQCHGRMQKYYETGEDILGSIEREVLAHVSPPGPLVQPETAFSPTAPLFAGAVPMKGFIDQIDATRLKAEGVVVVVDYKFKKDIVKYGTTPAKLMDPADEDGIQMIGYGEWVRVNRALYPGVKWVILRHVHVQTALGKREAKHRSACIETPPIPVADFEKLWKTVSLVVPGMAEVAKQTEVVKVEGNPKACWKYGGCPYRDVCPSEGRGTLKMDDRIDTLLGAFGPVPTDAAPNAAQGETTMGLLDELDEETPKAPAKAPAKAAPASAAKAPPKKPLIEDESTETDEAVKERLAARAAKAAAGVPTAGEVRIAQAAADSAARQGWKLDKGSEDILARAKAHPAAFQPPDAPKSDPKLAAKVDAPEEAQAPEAAAPAPAKPAKAPKKAKAEPAAAAPAEPAPAAEAPTAYGEKAVQVHKTVIETDHVLWFGVQPVGLGGAQPLNGYAAQMEREVLAKFKEKGLPAFPDIRCSSGEGVGFGKWKGFLAAHVKANPPPSGHYLVMHGDERLETVAHALLDAGAVIGGVR